MRTLTTLAVVFPLLATAQTEPSPPRWSLGAGISTGAICAGSSAGLAGPGADASLERQLLDSTWLVMGVTGDVRDDRQRTVADESSSSSGKRRQLTLDLGVRQRLTGRGAPVEVSILAVAQGGYGSSRGSTDGPASLSTRQTSWALGGNVGLAVDRELASGLTLRVATPLAGVWRENARMVVGDTTSHTRSTRATVYLAPRLELRLAF